MPCFYSGKLKTPRQRGGRIFKEKKNQKKKTINRFIPDMEAGIDYYGLS